MKVDFEIGLRSKLKTLIFIFICFKKIQHIIVKVFYYK